MDDERTLTKLQGDVTHVRNSREAMDLLLTGNHFDELWLDHDLGVASDGTIHPGADQYDSTMPIVQALAESVFHDTHLIDQIGLVVIHTANPVGRDNIAGILERWKIPHQHADAADYL